VGTGFAHNATTQDLRAVLRFRLKAKRSKGMIRAGFLSSSDRQTLEKIVPRPAEPSERFTFLWIMLATIMQKTFDEFIEAVMGFFKTTLPREWMDLRDIVSDNFHIIRPQNFRVLT
jgi:hypothetical protein